jgi:hypothetical protein
LRRAPRAQENENILVSASGDGSIKVNGHLTSYQCKLGSIFLSVFAGEQVWDLSAPVAMNPLRSLEEHSHEVYSLEWNPTRCVNPTQVYVNPPQVYVNPPQVCVHPTQGVC